MIYIIVCALVCMQALSILHFIQIRFFPAVSRSKTRRRVCGLGAWVQRTAQIEKCNRLVELGTQA